MKKLLARARCWLRGYHLWTDAGAGMSGSRYGQHFACTCCGARESDWYNTEGFDKELNRSEGF